MQIRHNHPYGFRSGEWATITGLRFDAGRLRAVYDVRFSDGIADSWDTQDQVCPYEFRESPPPDPVEQALRAVQAGLIEHRRRNQYQPKSHHMRTMIEELAKAVQVLHERQGDV